MPVLSREEIAARIAALPDEQQGAAAQYALEVYGTADQPKDANTWDRFAETRYDPAAYISKRLGWTPWAGDGTNPGQQEVVDAYVLALRQQHEREAFEAGELKEDQLEYWTPGQTIKNVLRIEAGHTVGKTKLTSGLVNHFFDHFTPSIIYSFAPTFKQIHDLLWKEIKTDRRGKKLPGKILDMELKCADDHFASGTATNDSGGRGTERIQGQHGKYLMFVLDEAEGIPEFVYNAVDSMTSGGICIVLMLANPRTRTSIFHKAKAWSHVRNFRISCVHHPNVVAGREIVPGAVKRQYVEKMIEKHCEVVTAHNEDDHTFALPFDVTVKSEIYRAGVIFKPNAEFLFRVLGIAPANITDNTLVSPGRFEGATKREQVPDDPTRARLGVDVARFGKDYGTLFIRWNGLVWRAAQFWKQDTNEYARAIRECALKLAEQGVTSLHVRVDGGGGFGGGVIDKIKVDLAITEVFTDYQVFEVHFNAAARDGKSYADLVTEMHGEAAETLKGVRLEAAPETLESDLCERQYKWVNKDGRDVKKLEPKPEFRKRIGRSPDDGDGFVLCVSPDFLFESGAVISVSSTLGAENKERVTGVDAIFLELSRSKE
jgi:hypothetical protein